MPAHRAATQSDPLSAHLPALILAAVVLAACVVLLGAHVTEMAGLAPYAGGGTPTVTKTPDDPAAAQPWTMPKR